MFARSMLAGVALLLFLSSCSDKTPNANKQQQPEIQIDKELLKISSNAAVMQLTLSIGKLTYCMLADAIKTAQEKELQNVRGMAAEATTICDLMSHADQETKATYEQIKRDGRLLEEQYFFSIYVSGDSATEFHEDDIGLFATATLCKQIEQEAFMQGIPVKKCRLLERKVGSDG